MELRQRAERCAQRRHTSRIIRVVSRRIKSAKMPVLAIVAAICMTAIGGPGVRAQSADASPFAFDVASVKLSRGTPNLHFTATPGALHVTSITVRDLIEVAYEIKDIQLVGAPDWVSSERYDIDTKLDEAVAQEEAKLPAVQQATRLHLRLQSLLADRFKLTISHATKELPIFALVVAKGGPKFSAAAPSPPVAGTHAPQAPPGRMAQGPMPGGQWLLMMNGAPMSQFLVAFGDRGETAGHFIVDESGLTATYTFTLHWTPENQATADAAAPDPADVSLFTALQEQLGLKVESRKGPVPAIVVEHIERPSEN
jgi:uncharacterized protein (TIGR03435 family)